jgi:hypothetical protein
MADSLQFHCTINNRCDVPLKLKGSSHSWGRWYPTESDQPKEVPAKQATKAFSSSGRTSSASGTEGYVIYQLGDDANAWIKIYWDVPWAPGSDNKVNLEESHEDIVVAMEGFVGSGSTESIILKVIDGRD